MKERDYFKNYLGYVFQNYALVEEETVWDNLKMLAGRAEVTATLTKVGLDESFLNSKIYELSGGQAQRVSVARLLLKKAKIILADEPTGALDTKAARLLMEKLQEVNQVQGRTILMVTHDPNAASFCSRILFIQDGIIFHELRRKAPTETREEFYARILQVMAQMGGGSANVL